MVRFNGTYCRCNPRPSIYAQKHGILSATHQQDRNGKQLACELAFGYHIAISDASGERLGELWGNL